MPRPVVVRVDTRRMNRIVNNLPGNTSRIVRSIAFAVERKAKEMAPVDTGALRASIYTKTAQAQDSMPSVPGDANRVDIPDPPTATSAVVGPSVEYAIDVELGTSRAAAQPFLLPAVRVVASAIEQFNDDWQEALSNG